MRLDINYKKKKKTVRNTNTQILNNMFLNNQQVAEEIKRKIKNFLEKKMTMRTRQLKTYGMHQKQFYEGSLQQYNLTSGNKKTLNRQPNFTPKAKEKRRKKNYGKERNHKDPSRNK